MTDEGVSAYPREVTAQMVLNFLRGGAGVNVLASHVGAEVRVVDIGVDHDFGILPGLIAKKVARGTEVCGSCGCPESGQWKHWKSAWHWRISLRLRASVCWATGDMGMQITSSAARSPPR